MTLGPMHVGILLYSIRALQFPQAITIFFRPYYPFGESKMYVHVNLYPVISDDDFMPSYQHKEMRIELINSE